MTTYTIKDMVFTGKSDIKTARGFVFDYTVRLNPNTGKYDVIACRNNIERQKIDRGFDSMADAIKWANDDNRMNRVELLEPVSEPVSDTLKWFELAVPEPTIDNKAIQIGCHFEEVTEMLVALTEENEVTEIFGKVAESYKTSHKYPALHEIAFKYIDKPELLDSLCDQIVTALGVGHMFGFDMQLALAEVNRSNFSKFENGKPVFDENGKIKKGVNYSEPNLKEFV